MEATANTTSTRTALTGGGAEAIAAEATLAALREEQRADRNLAAFLRNPRRAVSAA